MLTATARLCATSAAAVLATALLSTSTAAQTASQQSTAAATTDTAPQSAQDTGLQSRDAPQAGGPAGEGDVVVTGSRIARRGAESASPIQVIDSKEIDARGFETVAQALNELPTFGIPGASPVGFGQSGEGAGQSFVNFLGLGSQRTLVLVNGRRFVSSNTSSVFGPTGAGGGQVDLNVIPTKLIDRIETVVAIGAPVYGSDAIAGTINIILKHNFEGIDVDAQEGVSRVGDAPDNRFRAIAGHNFLDGRLNVTLAGEYDESKGLLFTDRAVTTSDDRFDTTASGGTPFPIYRDLRVPSVDPNGVPVTGLAVYGLDFPLSPQQTNVIGLNANVNNAAGQAVRFDQNGNLTPINFGTPVGNLSGFNVFTSGGNAYTLRNVENLVTDLKRYNTNLELSFQVTPGIRLFGEGWYSVSQGRNLASQPAYNSGLFGAAGTRDGSLIVPLSNPFLSAAARTTIANAIATSPASDQNFLNVANQNYFYLGRANIDLSSGVSTGRSQVLRGVGGIDGDLHVLPDKDWKFEAFYDFGVSLVTSQNPELNQRNFLNAFNSTTNAAGQIICAPGYTNSPIATLSSTCAPFNPFGQQNSQAVRDYITTIATPRNVNKEYDAVASVSGPLVKLPGGDFAFSLGYEHRVESSSFNPGSFYLGATTIQNSGFAANDPNAYSYGRETPFLPVNGRFHTNEIFGELNADLIGPSNHVPFVYQLTFQSAGRYIWNSTAGADPTYTFQGRYAPVRDIAFRGAYTRAVRAPSITEAFNPSSSFFGFAVDVCDQSQLALGPDPTSRKRNCAAAGVPTTYQSLSNQRSFLNFVVGNPALQNEKSDAITAGTVITPRFVPGFTLTADYVDIRLKNAIEEYTGSQVVEACYDSTSYPSNPFCSLIARDPASHQLTSLGTSFFNSAELRYKGLLVDASYRRASPFLGAESHIGLSVNYQYLISRTDELTAGSVPVKIDDSVGYSHHKGIATVSYDNRGFSGQVQVDYIGRARYDPNSPDSTYVTNTIPAFTYLNLSVSQTIADRFTLHADVDNVLNAKAPSLAIIAGGEAPYIQGIIGTYFRVGASVHF